MANLRTVQLVHAINENKLFQTCLQNSIQCLPMGLRGLSTSPQDFFEIYAEKYQKSIYLSWKQSRDQDRPIGNVTSRVIYQQSWFQLCLKTSTWKRRECSRALVSELSAIEVMSPDLQNKVSSLAISLLSALAAEYAILLFSRQV